jgi:two-component system NtrC family sensor kinase
VRRAVENTLAILQDGMERRGVRIATDLEDDLPPVALSQGDLEQVFLNLLGNARDAMPSGGQVTIAARGGGGGVEVAIADTGCGIAADALGRVEEPFFTTKSDGSGLGLSICRSILWEVDAEMEFESRPGTGTTVRLVLPPAAGEGRA